MLEGKCYHIFRPYEASTQPRLHISFCNCDLDSTQVFSCVPIIVGELFRMERGPAEDISRACLADPFSYQCCAPSEVEDRANIRYVVSISISL